MTDRADGTIGAGGRAHDRRTAVAVCGIGAVSTTWAVLGPWGARQVAGLDDRQRQMLAGVTYGPACPHIG